MFTVEPKRLCESIRMGINVSIMYDAVNGIVISMCDMCKYCEYDDEQVEWVSGWY